MQINFNPQQMQQFQMVAQMCAEHPGCVDCELNNEQGKNGMFCETAIMRIREAKNEQN